MNLPVVEEPTQLPTPPTEIDLGIPNPPKFETSGETTIVQPEDTTKNLKMSAKPKRKYNKNKGTNTNHFKNKK
jgi:hypothetical protein